MTGWIKVYRELREHWIWKEKPFSEGQAWIDLLFLANWANAEEVYKGKVVKRNQCEIACSTYWLAGQWGWSQTKTQNFLNRLKADGMIVTTSTRAGTIIRIVNYKKYQGLADELTNQLTNQLTAELTADVGKSTVTAEPQLTDELTSELTERFNNKNIKKKKTKTNSDRGRNSIPPTVEEVRAYCEERRNGINAEYFVDYYTVRNWYLKPNMRMKDWQAAVRTWERNNKQWGKERSTYGRNDRTNTGADSQKETPRDFSWLTGKPDDDF